MTRLRRALDARHDSGKNTGLSKKEMCVNSLVNLNEGSQDVDHRKSSIIGVWRSGRL